MTDARPWEESQAFSAGILFMKVGTHANEPLEDIVARKQLEILEAGFALWGYGGNTCHPTRMVQPFAETLASRGSRLVLAMHSMESKHFADRIRARQYSANGLSWHDIPAAINALGSRYALWISSLEPVQLELPLGMTRVAWGPSAGRGGDRYVNGRVDKACLDYDEHLQRDASPAMSIGLIADVVEPYAVFLR